ncbi:hypothetical protein BC831DRAFT_99800 [Entophlyctis helioformis]|nr:hypothetical protein BC831DRAFT_99800 [Entophlyctis helioformis]
MPGALSESLSLTRARLAGQGDRTDEEKDVLLKRIEQLNKELEMQTARWTLLNNQLKRSQEDLRHAKRQLDTLTKTKDQIITNIEELNMYNESATHQLAAKSKEKEDVMVEENILRLELRKLRGFLNARADEVFSLESRQVQLQLALEERAKEIAIHKDMLRIQIKNAEEERHSAAAELRERVGKVEKLKKRFEILMTQFAPEEGEEEHTQAYYVIKAAQRREELQREGDELDANIRRAEKEIKALENTLKMMNDRNESYRMNLYKAELDSKDLQHKEMLETEYRQAMESYRSKREQIQDLQQQIQQLELALTQSASEEASKLQSVQLLTSKLQTLDREIQDQQVKRDRATKLIESSARSLRQKRGLGPHDVTTEEQDFAVRKAKEVGTALLTELGRVGMRVPEFNTQMQRLMQSFGVFPPSRQLSRVSSRMSSRAPSVAGSVHEMDGFGLETGSVGSGGDGWAEQQQQQQQAGSGGGSGRGSDHGKNGAGSKQGSRAGSRAGSVAGLNGGDGATGSGRSTPKRMSTTNINDMSGLPPAHESVSRSGSFSGVFGSGGGGGAAGKAGSPGTAASPEKPRGPITGSQRIKQPARPGSANSVSSHGSKGSLK